MLYIGLFTSSDKGTLRCKEHKFLPTCHIVASPDKELTVNAFSALTT